MDHALSLKIAFVLLVLSHPAPIQAQQWPSSLELELRGGASLMAEEGFQDGHADCCHAHGWVKDARGRASLAGQVRLPLTKSLIPYFGVHQRSFGDREVPDLLTSIYGADLTSGGMPAESGVHHLVRGVALGISIEPEFPHVRPVFFGELSRDRFESNTSFSTQRSAGDRDARWIEGNSRLVTAAGLGWAVGGGVRLGGSTFELRPAIRYVSMSAPVTSRTFEWTGDYDGDGTRGGAGDLTIPEGQQVRARHFEVSLGLSYRVAGN